MDGARHARYMMQQLASSVCCRRLSWKLRRSRVEVVASMRKRSRDSNGIWLATWCFTHCV